MWKVIRKGLIANKVRFLLTGIAVILGVAFISGTLVLTATIQKTFDDLFSNVYENTDAIVRAPEVLSSDFGSGQRPNIPDSLLPVVKSVPSVEAASGNVDFNTSYAQLVDSKGKAIGGGGPPTAGIGWNPNPKLSQFHLIDGHAPESNNEIVIDKHTADKGDFAVGQKVKVLTQLGTKQYNIVGIAKFGNADSLAGASMTLFTLTEAQRINNAVHKFGQIEVVAKPGVSQQQVQSDIAKAIASEGDFQVLTGKEIIKETQDAVAKSLSFFNIIFLVFGLVALFVGTIIIFLTFQIVVAQRTREMALLRALGGSRRQVLGQVLMESVLTGLLASAIGVVLGVFLAIGLRALLNAFGVDLPSTGTTIPASAIIVGLIAGTLVTVLSAITPAVQASRIPPVAALRDTAIERKPRVAVRLAFGILIMGVLGVGSLFYGLFGHPDNAIRFVGIGAFAIFLGAFILGPLFAAPFSRLIASPLPRIKGMTGLLARENAARNPKRTAYTATTLLIGVALVGFITIFAASAKKSVGHAVDSQFKTDYIITSGGGFGPPKPIPQTLAADIKKLPEIGSASGVAMGDVGIAGARTQLFSVDPDAAAQMLDYDPVVGSFSDLTNGIAISKKQADDHHWKLGDNIPATFVKTHTVSLPVQFIFKANAFGDYYISTATYEKNYDQHLDFVVIAKLKPGVSAEQGTKVLTPLVDQYPTAELKDNAQYKADQEAQINTFVALVYVLLLLALVIALIGIANTLALSIHERTRELGLLRAVGMSRSQVRSSIRWESVIIALLGTINGLAIGLLFGWSLVRALKPEGFTQFAIAPGQLIVVVLILAIASVGAAIFPARRAAKLDVLQAISTE
jgi:putative ABC transport system permease protein